MAAPAKLILLTIFANILVTLQNIIHISGLNFVKHEIVSFINSSCYDHYGIELNDQQLSLFFGGLTALPFFVAIFAMNFGKLLAEKFGRKFTLFLIQTGFAVTAGPLFALAQWMNRFELLFIGRISYGVSYSLYITLLPLYIAECCPPKYMGSISSLGSFINNVLACITYVLALPQFLGSPVHWNTLFLLPILPSMIILAIYRWIPETPKFTLLCRRDQSGAAGCIRHFYGLEVDEAAIMKGFFREADQAKTGLNLKDIWTAPHLRRPLLISLAVGVSRVTCGYMLIYTYSISIIEQLLNLDNLLAKYATISLTVITTFASIGAIVLMQKIGRRKVFLGGLGSLTFLMGIFVILSLLLRHFPNNALSYSALICLLLAAVCFDLGPSSVTLYLVNEITPQGARSQCSAISNTVSIILRLIYVFVFPVVQDLISVYSILIMVVIPTSFILMYLFFMMPETSKVPVHEVVDKWVEKTGDADQKNHDLPFCIDLHYSRKFSVIPQVVVMPKINNVASNIEKI